MLKLKIRVGDWFDVERDGRTIGMKIEEILGKDARTVEIVFDDPERHFEVRRKRWAEPRGLKP